MSRPHGAGRRGPATRPFGFNVIGYVSGDLGLGVAARATIDILERKGEQVAVVDIIPPRGRGTVNTYNHLRHKAGSEAPYAFNIFHLNPPEISRLAHSHPTWMRLRHTFNACVPFWELPRLPLAWMPTMRAMDLVLAPSRFVQAAVSRDLRHVPCIHYPQAVPIPPGIVADRERWGLPPDAVVFLVSFDANSDVERKNPWAAIKAFRQGQPHMPKAALLVKVLVRGAAEAASGQLSRLHALAASTEGVRLLDEELTYEDTLSLYASCDVIVSTHRSEGLGLVLMEAMSLGKPVIATGWSGNMDFTTAENSLLLPPRMVRARGSQTQYSRLYVGREVAWADTDVDEIAEAMRTLAADPALRKLVGDQARRDMEAHRREVALGHFVDESIPYFRELLERGATGGRSPLTRDVALAGLPIGHVAYRTAAYGFARLKALSGLTPAGGRQATVVPNGETLSAARGQPLVSILTPSYNQGAWLADNLRSVRSQTYPSIEHLVMDGGSVDGSVGLLRQASPRVYWRSEPDRGQSHALNKALEESRGEIIGWLNSDDAYFDRNVVRAVVDFFARHPEIDVVYGHGAYVNADGKVLLMIYAPSFSHALLRRYCFILQPSLFMRRRALTDGFVDESFQFAMDWELWLRLARDGRRFARIDRVIAIDRLQPGRKTVTALDIYKADTERLTRAYGLPQSWWQPVAVRALYVGLRIAGARLLLRPTPDLAFTGSFDGPLRLVRRQVASRRTKMPMEGDG